MNRQAKKSSLKERALDLFEREFRPWLEQCDGAIDHWKHLGEDEQAERGPLEELDRRGLVMWDQARIGFRPSEQAVAVWQGDEDIREILGLESDPQAESANDCVTAASTGPDALLQDAKRMFEEAFLAKFKRRNNPSDTNLPNTPAVARTYGGALAILQRCGLVEKPGSCYRISAHGIGVFLGETDLDVAVGIKKVRPPELPVTTVIHAENIGAVNSAPHGSAFGSVNVSGVDGAMHRLVDMQDELGELSDQVWGLLRRLRHVEASQNNATAMKTTVEALEIAEFARNLREDNRQLIQRVLEAGGTTLVGVLKGIG